MREASATVLVLSGIGLMGRAMLRDFNYTARLQRFGPRANDPKACRGSHRRIA